tara:strand:+ start:22598 stop:23944 length:1347 start_codon:yes stop_codon:yes gene_type:complete
MDNKELNSKTLEKELAWLQIVIETRFNLYFEQKTNYKNVFEITPPNLAGDNSVYAKIMKYYNFSFSERLLISLTLAPHIKPRILDIFFNKNEALNRGFTEFGGIKGATHGGFIPTGETAAFLIAGEDIGLKIELMHLLDATHILFKHKILSLSDVKSSEPMLSGALVISEDYLDLFTFGVAKKPRFSSRFPATQVEISGNWDSLVLDKYAKEQVENILSWMNNNHIILEKWNLKDVVKPGYRALFHGPPGTGKTLTAGLLGKSTGKDVYRIDVSMVTSKWVGETEKNLARVFDMAESKDWILFFDEADALFGKRTSTSSSQDRYANQEVSYLLQRTEEYPGVVILASNLKGNIDQAFTRRFQSIVYFRMPDTRERLSLWEKAFGSNIDLDHDIKLDEIAKNYEISGGSIINILKYCVTKAAHSGKRLVTKAFLMEGIKNEMMKEGKTA